MAAQDTTRVAWEDGLVLGADELVDEQAYFRAAIERRSVARDVYGIASGLELEVKTPGGGGSGIVRLSPGVAYGGDGKVIVVRDEEEISSAIAKQTVKLNAAYAVYLSYDETAAPLPTQFTFCGQGMDPRITENYRIDLDPSIPIDQAPGHREGIRIDPQATLGGTSTTATSRVLLGIVDLDSNGKPSIRKRDDADPCKKKPTAPDPDALPAMTQYIGVLAATIVHPYAWTHSTKPDEANIAIEIDPVDGVHLHQRAIAHAGLYLTASDATFHFTNGGGKLTLEVCKPNQTDGSPALTVDEKTVSVLEAFEAVNVATFDQKVVMKDELEVDKTVHVLGKATLDDELAVTKKATLGGAQIKGSLDVDANENTTLGGKLTVVADTTLADVTVNGAFTSPGTIVAQHGLATVLPVASGTVGSSLVGLAVIFDTVAAGHGVRAASGAGEATKVIGIVAKADAANATVVVAGAVIAKASGNAGELLVLDPNNAGQLIASATPQPNTLVAKMIDPNQKLVVLTLG